MPMLTAGLQEMLVLTATSHTTLRSQRHRGTAVAAFGTTQPLLDTRWLLIDGAAMLIRDDLVRSGMFMQGAAVTTRAFWPEWTVALAHIEHRDEPWLFTAAELSDGKWWCASGLAKQLPEFVEGMPTEKVPRRLFNVNIPQIMLDMEARAEKIGLDLSRGSFSLPPDHELLVSWMEEFRQWRRKSQEHFDPLHMKEPRPPTAKQRKAIEAVSCDALH